MKNKRIVLISSVLALCLSIPATTYGDDGLGKRIGERLDQVLGDVRQEAKDIAGQVREGFEKVRGSVERMGVAGRVYARLYWDKALNKASISVNVNPDGAATLDGTVGSEADKKRAEELAQSTVGVERVINNLQVVSTPEAHKPDAKP